MFAAKLSTLIAVRKRRALCHRSPISCQLAEGAWGFHASWEVLIGTLIVRLIPAAMTAQTNPAGMSEKASDRREGMRTNSTQLQTMLEMRRIIANTLRLPCFTCSTIPYVEAGALRRVDSMNATDSRKPAYKP